MEKVGVKRSEGSRSDVGTTEGDRARQVPMDKHYCNPMLLAELNELSQVSHIRPRTSTGSLFVD